MKRRYFTFIALSLILVMLVLSAGCGVRINGKEYELFSVSEKDKESIIVDMDETQDDQQISEEKQDGEQLEISNDSGNVTIEKSEGTQIKIKVDKKVRGSSKDKKNTILENMNVKLERDGKVIKVVVKTDDGKDFWDWQQDNYRGIQTTINYDISLPEGINVIEVNTGAGNIDVNDVSAKLSLETGAGNIDVQDVVALEDNSINTGAGNIDFNGNIDKISSFDASTGVGNVKFKVPEGTKMSLNADTGVGVLSGEFIKTRTEDKFHFSGDINGGGPEVNLNTGVGNVKADDN